MTATPTAEPSSCELDALPEPESRFAFELLNLYDAHTRELLKRVRRFPAAGTPSNAAATHEQIVELLAHETLGASNPLFLSLGVRRIFDCQHGGWQLLYSNQTAAPPSREALCANGVFFG